MNVVNLILISNVTTTDIMTTGVDKDEFYTYASCNSMLICSSLVCFPAYIVIRISMEDTKIYTLGGMGLKLNSIPIKCLLGLLNLSGSIIAVLEHIAVQYHPSTSQSTHPLTTLIISQ